MSSLSPRLQRAETPLHAGGNGGGEPVFSTSLTGFRPQSFFCDSPNSSFRNYNLDIIIIFFQGILNKYMTFKFQNVKLNATKNSSYVPPLSTLVHEELQVLDLDLVLLYLY